MDTYNNDGYPEIQVIPRNLVTTLTRSLNNSAVQ